METVYDVSWGPRSDQLLRFAFDCIVGEQVLKGTGNAGDIDHPSVC